MIKLRKHVRGIVVFIMVCVCTGCDKALNVKDTDYNPVQIFEELWSVMDQRYSMFAFKGTDWKLTYDQYRRQVTDHMDDKALFTCLGNMLETLKDGHVTLISASDTVSYQNFFNGYSVNFNYSILLNNYLRNDYKTCGPVIYKVVSGIGYIYYGSFARDISERQMDTIFSELRATRGLIVDVRSNAGGSSANVNRLFARFLSSQKLVKYELIKSGPAHDDFLEPRPFYLVPSSVPYLNPVVVLTNRTCFSACNDFALYMSGLPNILLMGDQTGGGGGVPHNYILSNGWKLQYSSTITLSPEMLNIENGIQPDVKVGITSIDETNGRDPIVEKAFQQLQ